ncbi:MAG: hypothetical protein MSG64_00100 [Pyrinomonadaceae bacterium MAG19_C2-C3]|nr:hypothetical protein [Pyrinomonadaceae bacterium MAG19_C2-C3]
MNEDTTRNLPSFEERVLSELAAMRAEFRSEFAAVRAEVSALNTRMASVETRLTGVETRLTKLEDKVDSRLRETRPIWEGVVLKLNAIETLLSEIKLQFDELLQDIITMRGRIRGLEQRERERLRPPAA